MLCQICFLFRRFEYSAEYYPVKIVRDVRLQLGWLARCLNDASLWCLYGPFYGQLHDVANKVSNAIRFGHRGRLLYSKSL